MYSIVSFLQSKLKAVDFADVVTTLTSVPNTVAGAVFDPKKGKIPNQTDFPKAFYRLLDSEDLDEGVKERALKVEEGLFVRKVLDLGQWPDRPEVGDHLNADRVVAETIWSSLEERYRRDKDWKDPSTAPLLVRNAWSKNRKDKEDKDDEEED